MIARRPLGETLGELADLTGALGQRGPDGLRVRSLHLELPLDLRLGRGAAGHVVLADLPQFLTRTAFDPAPARLSLALVAVPATEPAA